MSKNLISKAIDREVINNLSLSDLRKVNNIVNKALMRVSEKERQGFKSEKEKEIEVEAKFQQYKEYFPENPEKLRSILQGLSF
jgi:tRNA U34 5-carboxymethylaminomethyl modifying enzyme MnmG/GidA